MFVCVFKKSMWWCQGGVEVQSIYVCFFVFQIPFSDTNDTRKIESLEDILGLDEKGMLFSLWTERYHKETIKQTSIQIKDQNRYICSYFDYHMKANPVDILDNPLGKINVQRIFQSSANFFRSSLSRTTHKKYPTSLTCYHDDNTTVRKSHSECVLPSHMFLPLTLFHRLTSVQPPVSYGSGRIRCRY